MNRPKLSDFNFDSSPIKRYEVDLQRGIVKADNPEDHLRALQTIEALQRFATPSQFSPPVKAESLSKPQPKTGLRVADVVEKYFQLKKHLAQSTALSYKTSTSDFAEFLGNPIITEIEISDVTRWQEFLSKENEPRTIDNKIGVLNTIFNFAIKQGYYFKDNPAAGRKLMTKKQRAKSGWEIFDEEQIQLIFSLEAMKAWKRKDRDFYLVSLVCLLTGCRISEITGLFKHQLKQNPVPHINIDDAKTTAGIRKVPLIPQVFNELVEFCKYKTVKEQVFRYKIRLGKGSGNAAGQKFGRHLDKIGLDNPKLVFHSMRKFFNDYSMKKGKVPMEVRCQMLGHEVDNINFTTYASEYEVDQLAEFFSPIQNNILRLTGHES